MKIERLKEGHHYHIYNRGVNGCNLFYQSEDYEHFLDLYDKYISPVATTWSWVLMPNHFHFSVKIKENVVYKYPSFDEKNKGSMPEDCKWETIELPSNKQEYLQSENIKRPVPHRHFAHLFNAFARHLNTKTGRTGNLFERPFKRKRTDDKYYLKQVILYIHNNPVHHGFCDHPSDYPWSSYLSCVSEKPTHLKRGEVLDLFGDKTNFKTSHLEKMDIKKIEQWLEIDSIDYYIDSSVNPTQKADNEEDEARKQK